jgi:hypothetical protein
MAQDAQRQEERQWVRVLARAWQQPVYKQRLMAEPAAVLREEGIEVPVGLQVRVVENTDQVFHLVLPQRPDDKLSDEQLDQAVGAVGGIDGSDLVGSQQGLQGQTIGAMQAVYGIEGSANLSDAEKMFAIQAAMSTWASIANLRTNQLKSVSDTLKSIGGNMG